MQVVVKKRKYRPRRTLDSLVIEAFYHVGDVSELGTYVRCRYKGSTKQDEIKRVALENGLPYHKLKKTVKLVKVDKDWDGVDTDTHTAGGVSGKVNMFLLAENKGLVTVKHGAKFYNGKLLKSLADWIPVMQEINRTRIKEGKEQIGLSGLFTVVSLIRSYCLRRLFNRWHCD